MLFTPSRTLQGLPCLGGIPLYPHALCGRRSVCLQERPAAEAGSSGRTQRGFGGRGPRGQCRRESQPRRTAPECHQARVPCPGPCLSPTWCAGRSRAGNLGAGSRPRALLVEGPGQSSVLIFTRSCVQWKPACSAWCLVEGQRRLHNWKLLQNRGLWLWL